MHAQIHTQHDAEPPEAASGTLAGDTAAVVAPVPQDTGTVALIHLHVDVVAMDTPVMGMNVADMVVVAMAAHIRLVQGPAANHTIVVTVAHTDESHMGTAGMMTTGQGQTTEISTIRGIVTTWATGVGKVVTGMMAAGTSTDVTAMHKTAMATATVMVMAQAPMRSTPGDAFRVRPRPSAGARGLALQVGRA